MISHYIVDPQEIHFTCLKAIVLVWYLVFVARRHKAAPARSYSAGDRHYPVPNDFLQTMARRQRGRPLFPSLGKQAPVLFPTSTC